MPFKSKAQRRKFAQLLVEGKITPEVYEEWNRSTGGAKLPERIHPKPSSKTKRKAKGKPKRKAKAGSAKAKRRAPKRKAPRASARKRK
jgi:hypothetical protein